MMDNILTQEKELGKIRDVSVRQRAIIYNRAHIIAVHSADSKSIKKLLNTPLPPIKGLLGEAFDIHVKRCLHFFLEEDFSRLCKRLSPKGGNDNLVIEFKEALLVPLRQSVGSCFATAFLIYLQKTDLTLLSEDLLKVFIKRSLTRSVEGEEVRIPLCPKIGMIEEGGIKVASALMKSYEFTTAALADVQVGFSRWNFHVALGLDHEGEGGLGKVIYTIVNEKLTASNEKLEQWREDIDNLERSLDLDDASFRSATTMDRMDRIKRAAKTKQLYLGRMIDDYEDEGKYTEKLSQLYKFFAEQYLILFPHYFQELYDPEMFSEGDIIEDRPAGFRLVYKHGRQDSRMWTYIHDDKEYIGALRDFITITEPILISLKRREGLDHDIESIISEVLLAIERKEFIEEQKVRIASMHKTHLGEVKNTSPYAYIAGGNLESLCKTYLSRVNPIKKERIGAITPLDLCYNLLEFMKDADIKRDRFLSDSFEPLLLTNDVHAFNFLPGQEVFKKGWIDAGNTYTYIRDVLLRETKPIVFADTNWAGRYLAFLPDVEGQGFDLVLYDGITIIEFNNWNAMFCKDAAWNVILL